MPTLDPHQVLYDCIRELYQETNPQIDKDLADEFDDHVKSVMYDLSLKLEPNVQNAQCNTRSATCARQTLASIPGRRNI